MLVQIIINGKITDLRRAGLCPGMEQDHMVGTSPGMCLDLLPSQKSLVQPKASLR